MSSGIQWGYVQHKRRGNDEKIPTLFVRDLEDRAHVTDEVTPGCEWVLAGEGVAYRSMMALA